jgi:hypothetical protein
MSLDPLFNVFDAWEVLLKARQPKGLAKWDKLAHISESLKGKKSGDITFTSAYPGQEGKKKTLGSVEGNLHFLMGYANPAFHVATYHWSIVDPNLSILDAEILNRTKGHPSRPELWERAGLEMKDEGDLVEGHPHPAIADVREFEKLKAARKAESITVSSGVGSYTAIPSEGIVYGEHNQQVYAWGMLRDSFLAAANPEMTEAMNAAADIRQEFEEEINPPAEVPELVKHLANRHIGEEFDDNVYAMVKSFFPRPSSVVPILTESGADVYGVVSSSSISFYNREGCPARVSVFDSSFNDFDLTKGGNIYSSVLYSMGRTYFGIPDDLEQYVQKTSISTVSPALEGTPTRGLEHVGDTLSAVSLDSKSVNVEEDGTYRLVVN